MNEKLWKTILALISSQWKLAKIEVKMVHVCTYLLFNAEYRLHQSSRKTSGTSCLVWIQGERVEHSPAEPMLESWRSHDLDHSTSCWPHPSWPLSLELRVLWFVAPNSFEPSARAHQYCSSGVQVHHMPRPCTTVAQHAITVKLLLNAGSQINVRSLVNAGVRRPCYNKHQISIKCPISNKCRGLF